MSKQKWYVCKACGARTFWNEIDNKWYHTPKAYGPKHKSIPIRSSWMNYIFRKEWSYR